MRNWWRRMKSTIRKPKHKKNIYELPPGNNDGT
jgi:hypothetical protein